MVMPSKEEKAMHTFPKNVAKMIFCPFGQTCPKDEQKLQKNEVFCIGLGQILLSSALHT
jgi:threonine/homoserine efflux transporter RhtA